MADNREDIEIDEEGLLQMPCSHGPMIQSNKPCLHQNHTQMYKVFASTWNVGGIAPPEDLDLEDWLDTSNNLYDIYVLGFQEIVPLNVGNVLGPENHRVSMKWNALIRTALNKKPQLKKNPDLRTPEKQKVYPVKDQDSSSKTAVSQTKDNFQCIISKQMVGILVSVWVSGDLRRFIRHASVSCVGCGIMGCLGNKGSVSVRFTLHKTSICFVCSHLASGGKEGDEIHRNSDVTEILSRTSFPRDFPFNLPRKILDHDRIIWLGDLNYRISLAESKTRLLVKGGEWKTLHENDQVKLRRELLEGRVLQGWKEEIIKFAPTYKYCLDSDEYYSWSQPKKGRKWRAPAWCDRIIWYGKGLHQIKYERGEERLSDHRPVRAIFIAEVVVNPMESLFLSQRYEGLEQSTSSEYMPKASWSFMSILNRSTSSSCVHKASWSFRRVLQRSTSSDCVPKTSWRLVP